MQPKLIIGLQNLAKTDWTSYKKYVLMQTAEESEAFGCLLLLQKHAKNVHPFDTSKWRTKYRPHLSEKSFLNILSKLYLWLEEWIVYHSLNEDKVRSGIELVKYFNRRGLFNLADTKARQVQQLIDSNTQYSPDMDYRQYQLYYYQFYSDNPIKNRDGTLVIKLMKAFLKWKNQASSVYLTQLNFWNSIKVLDKGIYVDLKQQLDVGTSEPVLYHLNRLVEEQDMESFEYCFNALKTDEFKQDDDFFTLLTMYLVSLSNKLWHSRKIKDPKEFTAIYEFAIEQGVLMNAGKLPHRRFVSIVNILGAFNSFEWTNAFIDRWGDSVLTDNTEGAKQFAKASNYFNHGYYEDSLAVLQLTNISQTDMRIGIHELSIKLYYETRDQNYDLLVTAMDKYQAYLRRRATMLAPANIKRGKNFMRNVKSLLSRSVQEAVAELHKPSSSTKWILEKRKEMG